MLTHSHTALPPPLSAAHGKRQEQAHLTARILRCDSALTASPSLLRPHLAACPQRTPELSGKDTVTIAALATDSFFPHVISDILHQAGNA